MRNWLDCEKWMSNSRTDWLNGVILPVIFIYFDFSFIQVFTNLIYDYWIDLPVLCLLTHLTCLSFLFPPHSSMWDSPLCFILTLHAYPNPDGRPHAHIYADPGSHIHHAPSAHSSRPPEPPQFSQTQAWG